MNRKLNQSIRLAAITKTTEKCKTEKSVLAVWRPFSEKTIRLRQTINPKAV